jgi:hypothetical protein
MVSPIRNPNEARRVARIGLKHSAAVYVVNDFLLVAE